MTRKKTTSIWWRRGTGRNGTRSAAAIAGMFQGWCSESSWNPGPPALNHHRAGSRPLQGHPRGKGRSFNCNLDPAQLGRMRSSMWFNVLIPEVRADNPNVKLKNTVAKR